MNKVDIKRLVVGQLDTNCYIVYSNKEGIVIDPGGDTEKIIKKIQDLDLNIRYIINTHGHADHIAGNSEIKKATGADLLIHKDDAKLLTDHSLNLSLFTGGGRISGPFADKLLEEKAEINLCGMRFSILHTPGHTTGGISLLIGGAVFTGDTLFAQGIGRTDFPGGNYENLIESIKTKLLVLDDNTMIYPGHGSIATLAESKVNNSSYI